MNDACFRKIQTLRLLPKAPARKSVSTLLEELTGQGFDIDRRSLQRDLKALSNLFPVENDGNKDIPGWYWRKDAEKLELPEMEPTVALSFRMVKLFLEKFMPPNTLQDLQGYFDYSDRVLDNLPTNHLSNWSDKIAMLSRSQPFLSPEVDSNLITIIYQALFSDKQLVAHYHPQDQEPRDYTINPLGLVVVDKILYLVGTLWDYKDIKQFAIHRFQKAEMSKNDAIHLEAFNLQDYIDAGHFEYLTDSSEPLIDLKLNVSDWLARHLEENPISEDQIIDNSQDQNVLTATVKNTLQLRWWLMGLGLDVEVVAPLTVRNEFAESFKRLNVLYSTS